MRDRWHGSAQNCPPEDSVRRGYASSDTETTSIANRRPPMPGAPSPMEAVVTQVIFGSYVNWRESLLAFQADDLCSYYVDT